jgi:hypothetical protein
MIPQLQGSVKDGWEESELDALVAAVTAYQGSGATPKVDWKEVDWKKIASWVSGRRAKQCKEKWANSLRPGLSLKEGWTLQEDYVLITAHSRLGTKWQSISEQFLPHRPENGIKNHW